VVRGDDHRNAGLVAPFVPTLTETQRSLLERWVRSPTATQRLVLRSRIVLLLADGASGRAVAQTLGISRTTVELWRHRFVAGGCDTLQRDKAGRGRKPRVPAAAGGTERVGIRP
jgi:Homeodomain-like domain